MESQNDNTKPGFLQSLPRLIITKLKAGELKKIAAIHCLRNQWRTDTEDQLQLDPNNKMGTKFEVNRFYFKGSTGPNKRKPGKFHWILITYITSLQAVRLYFCLFQTLKNHYLDTV